MTWTATQPELPGRMAADDLSEPAALAHYCALAWVQSTERFDCTIPRRLLPVALPLTRDVAGVEEELAAAGYWRSHAKVVELVDHAGYVQQSLIRVGKKRRTDADASKRYRDKLRADTPSVTDAATDVRYDAATDSDNEHAPRLPTDQANDPPRGENEGNGPPEGACRSCGEPSAFLLAGYCRRGECTEQRRKDNAA